MSQATTRFRLLPMTARDEGESGRVASSLELFFDLVFVIAVSTASSQLYSAVSSGDVLGGVVHYAIVFFGVWWAWMNFSWFATSFDNDDWLYRVMTFVQMAGALVLAAGIQPAFEENNYTILVLAYAVMRLALVAQWLRASRQTGSLRRTTLTYAGGVAFVQALWLGALLLPANLLWIAIVFLVIGEISVPVISEQRTGGTPWHPHHITERYSLFTLILLGESLLGSSKVIFESRSTAGDSSSLLSLAVLTFVSTACLWWIYFWPEHHRAITSFGRSLVYGYGHYFIFAAAGALSVGIEVMADYDLKESMFSQVQASFVFTVPVALFIFGVWFLAVRPYVGKWVNIAFPLAVVLVVVAAVLPVPFASTAVVLVGLVAVLVIVNPSTELRKAEIRKE